LKVEGRERERGDVVKEGSFEDREKGLESKEREDVKRVLE
jgi:hypothetical protein